MARLDDTSDPTSQNWVDSFNPTPQLNATPVSYDSPYFGGSVPSPAASQSTPGSWNGGSVPVPAQSDPSQWNGGSVPSPAQYSPAMPISQPGYITGNGGGGMAGTAYHAPVAPVHHNAAFYRDNGQAVVDPTYVAQKQALIQKLNDYEGNVARQVGDANLMRQDSNDPKDLLGFSYGGKPLSPTGLFNDNVDVNGDDHFSAKDISQGGLGGTLGADYATGIASFDNQQQHGLRNIAEDFAARGMLGSGSGVWQTARNNAQDQYKQQLGNMNNSAIGQYNNLLGNLGDQYSQGRSALTGYLTDASNRMATSDALNMPTSI